MKTNFWSFLVGFMIGVGLMVLVGLFVPETAGMLGGGTVTAEKELDWDKVTLGEISFGEPKTVLEGEGIKVWQWLPDNRRLLVEVRDEGAKDESAKFRIVTVDRETGKVVEYGRRGDEFRGPVWLERKEGVLYLFWNGKAKQAVDLRLGAAGGAHETLLSEGRIPLVVQQETARLLTRLPSAGNGGFRGYDLLKTPAEPVGVKGIKQLGKGILVSGNGDKFLTVLDGVNLEVLDLDSGEIKQHSFLSLFPASETERELTDGVWSPDGTRLMLVLAYYRGNRVLNRNYLEVWDAGSGELHQLSLPMDLIGEVDWGRSSRYVMLMNPHYAGNGSPAPTFWLVDTQTGEAREFAWLPTGTSQGWGTSAAWSGDGRWFAYHLAGEGKVVVRDVGIRK